MSSARRSITAAAAAGLLTAAVVASVASGGPRADGYNTAQAPMVTYTTNPTSGAPAGSTADAIISVGDTIGGYTFESIPDGVSVYPRGNGRVDVYVNHETSTVPFPYNTPFGGATPEANQNDFKNSEVSLLEMKQHKAEINKASKAISSIENLHRFCASFLATAAEGFKHPILFANEEAQDWVFRSGTSWPGPTSIPPASPGAEQLGVVFAHDVKTGKTKPIYGMGRHNHESAVAIPGFDDIVVLSGDDTFQTNPPASSQLYMYTAADSDELWDDAGALHAFVADGLPDTDDDYFDLQPGDTITGKFVQVPERIAKGKDPVDGHELTITDPAFPNDYPAPSGGPSAPFDGPQWILDQWGNTANTPSVPDTGNNVFDFIRLEDIAYDKNDPNVVYIADSGRATAGAANQLTTSTNGRIYKLELDPNDTGDPTEAEISILVQGDDVATVATDPVGSLGEIHQPDNLETTAAGNLLVTEDPSGNNQYALPADAGKTAARLWKVPLNNPEAGKAPLLAVDQALDENTSAALGAIDVDATTVAGRLGAWESSGIVDASAAFGPGAFFLTIQAHSYWVAKQAGPDVLNAPNGPDFFFKKEGGQLILLKMPGV